MVQQTARPTTGIGYLIRGHKPYKFGLSNYPDHYSTQAKQMTPKNWEDLMVEWQDSLRDGGGDGPGGGAELVPRPGRGRGWGRHERGALDQFAAAGFPVSQLGAAGANQLNAQVDICNHFHTNFKYMVYG